MTSILDKAGKKNGKLDSSSPPVQPPKCPECTSRRVWRDGLRSTKNGDVQRWLCRNCGYRFSQPSKKLSVQSQTRTFQPRSNLAKSPIRNGNLPAKKSLNDLPLSLCEDVGSHSATVVGKGLNNLRSYNCKRQVCVNEEKMKNLVKVETRTEKQAAGATTADVKGRIVEYAWWMKKQGYAESTIELHTITLKALAKRGANLLNPESVKDTIARQDTWSPARKQIVVGAYSTFLKHLDKSWDKPKYRTVRKLPFIPTESEVDQLIAGVGKKAATFLQLLKETGMRCGEAWQLKWTDLNPANRTVNITPEKGSNPRVLKVSQKLIAMLNALPKNSEKIFGDGLLRVHRNSFMVQRKRLAKKLNNPRLLKITFHTLRHFKATMEYHKTKDILHVQKVLGHKNIENTMLYTQLINFEEDEFISRAAKTVKGARALIEAGFEYICEMDGTRIFRKRK